MESCFVPIFFVAAVQDVEETVMRAAQANLVTAAARRVLEACQGMGKGCRRAVQAPAATPAAAGRPCSGTWPSCSGCPLVPPWRRRGRGSPARHSRSRWAEKIVCRPLTGSLASRASSQ